MFPQIQTSRKSSTRSNRQPPFESSMSIEDKIRTILVQKRDENYPEDLRRARVYLLMDLFYQGYQNVGPWDDLRGWPCYDDDPLDYQENRFQQNVLINAGGLIKMEPTPVLRPASGSFQDLEAAVTAQDAWEKGKDEIAYDQLVSDKSIHKCLFGNTFIYSGYTYGNTDKIMVPKMKFDKIEIPGASICPGCSMTAEQGTPSCPDCQMPMQQYPPIPSQNPVIGGYEERERGQLFSTAFSPLEVKIRSRVKGGTRNWPYVLRVFREDVEFLRYLFPDLDIDRSTSMSNSGSGSGAAGADAMTRWASMLGGMSGNVSGSSTPYWSTQTDYADTDVLMGWIRPQCYRGDKELEKEAPDGLMGVVIGKDVPEWHPEKIDDVWTHEVYFPTSHSAYGMGMFADIPVQRSINKVGQLTERHLEFDTIPMRLYDDSLILVNPNEVGNDPKKKFIPVNTTMEKGLEAAVRDLPAQQLSFDVNVMRQDLRQVDEYISGATAVRAGQVPGANTPYSMGILANEQGQTRFLPSAKYNKDAVKDHVRQVLNLAKKNWVDPRTMAEIDQNTGRLSWKQFVGADLGRGNWNVYIMDSDFKPKTRGEQMQALDMAKQYGIDILASPKMRLQFFEKIGLTPDGDTLSTQAKRASRVIERMKNGEPITPDPIVDDGIIQSAVILEYLASPQGDELHETTPQAWEAIKQYAITAMTMAAMKNAAFGGMGLPAASPQIGGPPPGQPGPPGQKQEMAQSPVGKENQQPMPQSPARQQQGAGTLPS